MRILLIEDDETLCQTIPFQLRQEGFSVDVAMNGDDGLHCAREQLHDLILLDRMLPGLDGMEVLSILRRENIQTPVIFLTALGQLHDRTTGLNNGADDYIVKPFAFEELLARIRRNSSRRSPSRFDNTVVLPSRDKVNVWGSY